MNKTLLTLAILAASEVAVVVGDVLAKRWVLGAGLASAALALGLYQGCAVAWLAILKIHGDLAKATMFWVSGSTIGAVLIGRFWFQERLSPLNWAGILMCMAGAALAAHK